MCDGMSARDLAQVVGDPPGAWREPAAVPTPQSPGVVVPPMPAHWPGRVPRCLRQGAAQRPVRRAPRATPLAVVLAASALPDPDVVVDEQAIPAVSLANAQSVALSSRPACST